MPRYLAMVCCSCVFYRIAKDNKMAKGQQRSNREVKKPKANKLTVSNETAASVSRRFPLPPPRQKRRRKRAKFVIPIRPVQLLPVQLHRP